MEWESDSLCRSQTYLRQGRRSPGGCNGWDLETVEQSQGKGCCWLWRDGSNGCEGGDGDGRCLWREARQPRKQDNTAESRVGGGTITIASLSPPASISSWTTERLAHQRPDALNYRVGPHPGRPFKCLTSQSTEKDPSQGGALYVPEAPTNREGPQPGGPLYVPEAGNNREGPQPGGPLYVPEAPTNREGPQPGGPLYVPEARNNREGPQAEPSKCLQGQSYGERLATEAFWSPATRGRKKGSGRAVSPAVETVRVPTHLAPPGPPQAQQLRHLHAQLSRGRSCRRPKVSCICSLRVTSVMSNSLRPCRLACQASLSGRGLSRQEPWSILVSTGCHALLEPYTSCCPSRQPPWGPGAARTPATPAAAPPPHLALTGANPSPPGQPQEQTPVEDPHTEVEIKLQLKPRGSVARKEDPKPSHQLYKLHIKSYQQGRLCL